MDQPQGDTDQFVLGRDQVPRKGLLELREPASRKQRHIAIDLRDQRLLRRHREDLALRQTQHVRTRTDLFLPAIVAVLNEAGIPDSDLFIVFALGIHRKQTEAERIEIIGEALHRRIRNFDHDCHDDAGLVTLGQTSFGPI